MVWAYRCTSLSLIGLSSRQLVGQHSTRVGSHLANVGLLRSMGWSGSPPYWSVGAGAKMRGLWSVHWMKIVGLTMMMAPNDWSAVLVGAPIPARSQPSIPRTSLHLETLPRHITRASLSPPFSSPWPTLVPKQRPKGRSCRPRQIIKVLILRGAKGHLPLTLAGNRPQGVWPRKGSSRTRATRRAERNCLRPILPPRVRYNPGPHLLQLISHIRSQSHPSI
jgi:hypothetical protein